jgi:hypothetical protein
LAASCLGTASPQSAAYTVYLPVPKDLNIDNYECFVIAKGSTP